MKRVLNQLKANFGNLLIALVLALVLIQRVPTWIHNYQREGTTAPHFSALHLKTGRTESLPLAQKAIYVFWATWCGPCQLELNRLQKAVSEGSLSADKIIAISSDEPLEVVQEKIKKEQWSFEFYHDSANQSFSLFGITGTPTVLQINANGKIESMNMGIQPLLVFKAQSFLKN